MPTQIACDTLCNDKCKVQLAARHTCTAHRHIGIHQFACLYSDVSTGDCAILKADAQRMELSCGPLERLIRLHTTPPSLRYGRAS